MFEGFRFWSEKPRPKEEQEQADAEIRAMKEKQHKIPEAKPSRIDPRATRGEHYAGGHMPEDYYEGSSDYPTIHDPNKPFIEPVYKGLNPEEEVIAWQESGVQEDEPGVETAGSEEEMPYEDYKGERDSILDSALMPSQRLANDEWVELDLKETEERIKEVKKIITKLEREMNKTSPSSKPNLYRSLVNELWEQKQQLARLGRDKALLEKEGGGETEEVADVLKFGEKVQGVHEKQIGRQTKEIKEKTDWGMKVHKKRTDRYKTARKGDKKTIRKKAA